MSMPCKEAACFMGLKFGTLSLSYGVVT